MTLLEHRRTPNAHFKDTSLVLLLRENQILLAMKKRGFGAGYWNGAGGKLDAGETVDQAAVRECQEEIGVTPLNLSRVANITFYFDDDPTDPIQNIKTTAYLCREWDGEPAESEEMAPKWFDLAEIPYATMWADDPHWMPLVLSGSYVDAEFLLDADNKVLDMDVRPRSIATLA